MLYARDKMQIYYPAVFGLSNRQAEVQINHDIQSAVQQLQREQLKVQMGTDMEMIGHFEIKTNERGLLSSNLMNYAYSAPMAHGFTVTKALTFDIQTGRLYSLADLFKPGTDYVCAPKLKSVIFPFWKNFKRFGLTKIIIQRIKRWLYFSVCMNFRLLSPYYVGFPMFPISVYDLLSIAAEGGSSIGLQRASPEQTLHAK